MPAEPVLRKFNNIENRDAVLAFDDRGFAHDEHGKVRFVWDRKTTKIDAVTGREVPDDKAVIPLETFSNPRPAEWPQADFIVGNPPFIGNKRMRRDLGDGYVEALRDVIRDVPGSADFVMFWWQRSAQFLREQKIRSFGFITTNTITQIQSGQVVADNLATNELWLSFAIPDHPWVDNADGAAVRISMSVCKPGRASEGRSWEIKEEHPVEDGSHNVIFVETLGVVNARLRAGLNVRQAKSLSANSGVCWQGVKLVGDGFQITPEVRDVLVGRDKEAALRTPEYYAGKDFTKARNARHVIDFFGLTESEARLKFPKLYDQLATHVRPYRIGNSDKGFREKWWLFGRPRPDLRGSLTGLRRYIATSEVAAHRVFQFLGWPETLVDGGMIAVSSDDASILGVLSSRIHVAWALGGGGSMGAGNDPRYQNEVCFDNFPFPDCTEKQKEKIRALAEELDAHRKRAQAKHTLGLTDIYNVLEKVRAGAALNAKEKTIHEAAFVSTLKQLHDDLDAAVADAYGWPWPLTDAQILERIVALNTARAAEEAKGTFRWLRPDYQIPLFSGAKQSALDLTETDEPSAKTGHRKQPKVPATKKPAAKKIAWPKPLADRVRVVETALAAEEKPATAADLAKRFTRANADDIAEILETLVTLGRARPGDLKGTFVR